MSREKLIELPGPIYTMLLMGPCTTETVVEIPVQNYFNEDRWEAEMD